MALYASAPNSVNNRGLSSSSATLWKVSPKEVPLYIFVPKISTSGHLSFMVSMKAMSPLQIAIGRDESIDFMAMAASLKSEYIASALLRTSESKSEEFFIPSFAERRWFLSLLNKKILYIPLFSREGFSFFPKALSPSFSFQKIL